jgi:hypothetical protein
MQGGTIIASSEEGRILFGFIMNFMKPSHKKSEPTPIQKYALDLSKESTTSGTKVLVVEDVILNQLLIKIILLDFGFDNR